MSTSDPPPSHGDWDAVAETPDVYEAELMALHLRAAGLEVRVIDQSFRQEPIPSVRAFAVVRVLVPAARAEEARQLLAAPGEALEDLESEEP